MRRRRTNHGCKLKVDPATTAVKAPAALLYLPILGLFPGDSHPNPVARIGVGQTLGIPARSETTTFSRVGGVGRVHKVTGVIVGLPVSRCTPSSSKSLSMKHLILSQYVEMPLRYGEPARLQIIPPSPASSAVVLQRASIGTFKRQSSSPQSGHSDKLTRQSASDGRDRCWYSDHRAAAT